MRIIITTIVLSISSYFAFGQDILKSLILEEYEVKNPKLESLVEAFFDTQSECISLMKNTVVIMHYEPNVHGDTNSITLRIVHSRDLNQSEYRGFIEQYGQTVFLYNGIEKLNLLKNTSNMKEFKISQRITYGNYLVNGNDTIFLVKPWPYEARWVIFQNENFILRDKEFDHPCSIKEEENNLEELLSQGWKQP